MKIPPDRLFMLATYEMLLKYPDLIAKERLNCSLYVGAHNFLDILDESEVKRIRDFFSKNGLGLIIHGPFVDLNPGSLDKEARKVTLGRFIQTVEITKMLGSWHITFHSGYRPEPYRKYKDEWLRNSLEVWKKAVNAASKEGIKLTVENAFEEDPALLIELVETVDSAGLNICFDGGHYNAFSDTPPLTAFDMLPAGRIGEIHLSDNDGSDDQHLPLGEGNIDLEALFRRIEELGVEPVFSLEPKDVEGAKKDLIYLKKKGLID